MGVTLEDGDLVGGRVREPLAGNVDRERPVHLGSRRIVRPQAVVFGRAGPLERRLGIARPWPAVEGGGQGRDRRRRKRGRRAGEDEVIEPSADVGLGRTRAGSARRVVRRREAGIVRGVVVGQTEDRRQGLGRRPGRRRVCV
jgi:hypothetical protein